MLTEDEVRHVAMLARLGLTDEEIETMRSQLLQALDYIAVLQQVDISAIAPTAQVLTHQDIMREDAPRPSWPADALLHNAPASEDSFFRVPAVFDEFRAGPAVSGTSEEGQDG